MDKAVDFSNLTVSDIIDDNKPVSFKDEALKNDDGKLVNDAGKVINEQGNLINEDGALINEDGKLIDENNNVIEKDSIDSELDADGNVIEKPEIDSDGNPIIVEDELTAIQEVDALLGYSIEGEFSDDIEGMAEYVKKAGAKIAEDDLNSMFTQLPDVKEYMEYRINGGDPSKYHEISKQEIDFADFKLEDNNVVGQKQVMKAMLYKNGYTEMESENMIQIAIDAGTLFKQTSLMLPKLQEMQKIEKQELINKTANEKLIRDNEEQVLIENIQTSISKGNFNGILIPENEKKEFIKWFFQPVDSQGNTARTLARQKANIESNMGMEYLYFKGYGNTDNFDFSNLISAKRKTKNIQTLKEKLKSKSANTRMATSSGVRKSPLNLPNFNDMV